MALAEDGKFLAMDVDLIGDIGAYIRRSGPILPMAAPEYCPASTTSRLSLPRPHRVHQYRAGRCLSRRRPPGGRLRGRAAGRRGRAQAWDDAGCDPAQEFHHTARDALQDRDRQGLRFRRFYRAYEAGDGDCRVEGISQARQGGEEAGPGARHRACHLCRGLRHDGRRDRRCAARSQWRRLGPDRDPVERAGPQDRLCANRGRAVWAGARACSCLPGRHRSGRHRPRHGRVGFHSDRRRLCRACHAQAWRQFAGDRGRGAGNRHRRSRDQRWRRAGRRHRPLGQFCRSGQAARRRCLQAERERDIRQRRRHLSERHPHRRGRDRSGHRHHPKSRTTSSSTISG